MLGKLIKYEWKNTLQICSILLLVLAGATVLGLLGISLPVRYMVTNRDVADDNTISTLFNIMMLTMTMGVYVISLIGISYVLRIYQGVHFYKTMYTDEGYLTHTLPVTPNQILFSKTLVAGCWNIILWIAMGASVALMVVAFVLSLQTSIPDIAYGDFLEAMSELKEVFAQNDNSLQLIHAMFSAFFVCLITPFSSLLLIYGSLTIGQLARKHKLLWGILTYVGIMFAYSILGQMIRFIASMSALVVASRTEDPSIITTASLDGNLVLGILTVVGMYALTHFIVSKKLNLD